MNEWLCDHCGKQIKQGDGEPIPRCSDCSRKMVRSLGGKPLPDGFRPCDARPNPFYAGTTQTWR